MNWQYRYTVLSLCTLAFFATMVARLVISPVVPDLADAFAVTNTAIGMALTGMWLTYALAQFPSGVLGDRFGERRVILAAVGLTALASALLAIAPSFPLFVVFTVCLGAGAGLHFSVATTLLTKSFRNTGTAIGLHNSGAPLAGLLAPVAAAYVGAQFGWRPAIALGVLVALPVFAAFAWHVEPTEPERPEQPIAERFRLDPMLELLGRRSIRFTVAMSVLGAFAWQSTASFLPTFLIDYHGYSQTFAGVVFSAYSIVHGITQPLLGRLSDQFGRDVVIAGCMALGVGGYALFVSAETIVAVGAAVALVGTAMSWSAAMLPRFMDHLSDEERGAGFGLVRTTYMVLGSLGSVVTGAVADVWGWAAAFVLLSALLAVVLAALVVVRARRAMPSR
ncbi:MAG: MFS transporter [Haloferacaceae archaeon]